jgi:hypothetical protein
MKRREITEQIRQGVTILDCTVKSRENCSEGQFLYEYIKILNHQRVLGWKMEPVDNYLYHIRSATNGVRSLDVHLKFALTQTIHISAHGNTYLDTNETYLEAGNSAFDQEFLRDIWSEWPENERPRLIVLSACKAGHKDLIEAFADGGKGCRYLIAPVLPADWERAAMFSALFYTFLFYGEPHLPKPGKPLPPLKPFEPVAAFKKAKKRSPRLTGWWKMFDYGDEIL